jgi:hypothetical protein
MKASKRQSSAGSSCVALSVLLILTACSGKSGETWTGTVTVEDGVIHVYNPETPLWGADHDPLRELEILGGPDSAEEAMLAAPFTVVAGADGSRYVLDGTDARIVRYDREGNYLGAFGRAGDGPGEFRNPTDMTLLPDGRLLVCDYNQERLSWFSPDGRFIESAALHQSIGQIKASPSGRLFASGQPRILMGSIRLGTGDPEEEPTLVDLINPDGERTGGFGTIREYEGFMLGNWMNRIYPAVLPGDSLAMNYLGLDRIEVYDPEQGLSRVVHRNLSFTPIEPVEESNVSEDGAISMSFDFDILSTGLAVHPDGTYWAVALAVSEPDRRKNVEIDDRVPQEWAIDLFDSTGRWLARHPTGADFQAAFLDWWPDGLYVSNPEGDATVRRFEVVPPE